MQPALMHRGSGVLLPITCLPSSGGIGDLGPEAYQFVDRLRAARQRYWQVLPLNPPSPRDGESPYFSTSAFAMSPLMVAPARLIHLGLLDRSALARSEVSGPPDAVDYEAVRALRYPLLAEAHRAFVHAGGGRDFRAFCEREAHWLDDYVLFTVLKRKLSDRSWADWPVELRDRDGMALERCAAEHRDECEREKFYQFLAFSEWNALRAHANARGIAIIGDLPIYVSYESADVWANPGLFELDEQKRPISVSGVPPDYFSATGQLWNNPVYRWDRLRRTGYRLWIRRFRALFERFDLVRIDHFRGLVQYWSVPAGRPTAIEGHWCDVPTDDFLDTVTSELPSFPVIAEDLGHITADVRDVMHKRGYPGMKVLQFAFDGDPENPHLPHNYDRNAVVYTGTHDNSTARAWLESEGIEARKRQLASYLGRDVSIDETCWELIRLASMSVANTCIVPLQDLLTLGADARINDPSKAFGNWRWRCSPAQMARLPVDRLAELTSVFGRDTEA